MVTGLITVVDDVGGVVRKLFFFAEVTVMNDGVDMADGTVKTNLVKVVVAAGVVQVKHTAVFQRLRQNVVGDVLLGQVLEHRTFINIVVGVKVELSVLEADLLIDF